METEGFFKGLTLSAVKNGRFLNKLGTYFTLSKLIYNSREYELSGVGNGAVIMSAGGTSWRFIAPSGRFTLNSMGHIGELLETIASGAETNPIPAWEDFAAWLAEETMTEQIDAYLSNYTSASVHEVQDIPIPGFEPPENVSALLRWVKDAICEAADLDTLEFKRAGSDNVVNVTLDLLTDYTRGMDTAVKIRNTLARPAAGESVVFQSDGAYIKYTDRDGAFSSPVLEVSTSLCSTFAREFPGFDLILYAYGTTRDTLGLNLVRFTGAGWRIANTSTGESDTVSMSTVPLMIPRSELRVATCISDYLSEIGDAYGALNFELVL